VSEQQQGSARDPLRHYPHCRHGKPGEPAYAGGSSFMERVSEAVASGMGSVAEKLTILTEQVHEVTCGRPSMS
jgi:hypothetical protein